MTQIDETPDSARSTPSRQRNSWPSRRRLQTPSQRSTSSTKARGMRAEGRAGEGLASARDRERLRERIAAERARVEEMLANVPLSADRREATRMESGGGLCCPVCGDLRIVTDEVNQAGTLLMSDCLHCDYRWTARPKTRWLALGARMNRVVRRRATATA